MDDFAPEDDVPPGKAGKTAKSSAGKAGKPTKAPKAGKPGKSDHPKLPMRRERDSIFFEAYQGTPPWDIGRAQPAFVELQNMGQITGSILDLGCGTGDLALELAEGGHEAWGVDMVPRAIDQAKAKARLRGQDKDVTFLVGDALEIEHLNRTFDTVLDCGLFHTFSDPERELYEQQLRVVTHPGSRVHIMAMSDWEDESWGGPRRVTQAELMDTFREGWRLEDIVEARFLVRPPFQIRGHAWLASFVREGAAEKKKATRAVPHKPLKKPAVKVAAKAGESGGKIVEATV